MPLEIVQIQDGPVRLVDTAGDQMMVVDGVGITTERAILIAGKNGAGTAQFATVLPASTAPLATDTALVVSVSPNSTLTAVNPSVGLNNTAIPTSSTQVGGTDGTNLQAARVFDADSGAGTQYVLGAFLRKAASGGSVEAGTASDPLRVDPTGTTTQPISVTSLPLPTGAATAALQTQPGVDIGDVTINNAAGAAAVNIQDGGNSITVDGPLTDAQLRASAVPVSAASLPLPTGAATEATLATRLADATFTARINTLGQKVMASSTPIVIASDQSVIPVSDNAGSLTIDTPQLPAALVGGRLDVNTGAWLGSTAPTVGQKTLAASLPVAIASDQTFPLVGDRFGTGTIVALNGVVAANTQGCSSIVFNVTGVWVATISVEGTVDGTNWVSVNAQDQSQAVSTSFSATNTRVYVNCGGFQQIRLDATAFTSGTVSVAWNAGAGGPVITQVWNTNAASLKVQARLQDSLANNITSQAQGAQRPLDIDIVQGGNTAVVVPASTAPITTDPALVVAISPNTPAITAKIQGYTYSGRKPNPSSYPASNQLNLSLTSENTLETHATVTTDEGSFRDDFPGAGLTTALTGTVAFTTSTFSVVGTGTSFLSQVAVGQWIKKSADSETLYVQVKQVNSDTVISLETAYAGTTATVAAVVSNWLTVTATGGTITVSTSQVSLTSGTTSGQNCYIERTGDYQPCSFQAQASVSQRIANQTAILGFRDNFTTPVKQALVRFTGTVNTQVDLVTSSGTAAADTQVTTVTLPNGGVTSGLHTYRVDVSGVLVTLTIDGVIVATHAVHIPGPYDVTNVFYGIANTAAAGSSTTLALEYFYFFNSDRLHVDDGFAGEPLPVVVTKADVQTYSATITGLVMAATPTDVFTITGSASKLVRITRITTSGTQTTATQRDVSIVKRSTANTAGTLTTRTAVPHDSNNAAATAVVRAYTANPTLGTLVGEIIAKKLMIQTTTGASFEMVIEPGIRNNQAYVLRGAAEVIAVNMNSVTSAGNSMDFTVEWTEE